MSYWLSWTSPCVRAGTGQRLFPVWHSFFHIILPLFLRSCLARVPPTSWQKPLQYDFKIRIYVNYWHSKNVGDQGSDSMVKNLLKVYEALDLMSSITSETQPTRAKPTRTRRNKNEHCRGTACSILLQGTSATQQCISELSQLCLLRTSSKSPSWVVASP